MISAFKWKSNQINVCWHQNTIPYDYLKTEIKNHVKSQIESLTNITLIGWEDCTDQSTEISIANYNIPQEGRSQIGINSSNLYPSMEINFDMIINRDSGWSLNSIVLHEIFHALGALHDHDRINSSCPNSISIREGIYFNNAYIGNEDHNSISSYCRKNKGDTLSIFDALGLSYLYGFPKTKQFIELIKANPLSILNFNKTPTLFPIEANEQKGDYILWIQMSLALALKSEWTKHDMIFTEKESEALEKYQKKFKLISTGTLTKETWEHMTKLSFL